MNSETEITLPCVENAPKPQDGANSGPDIVAILEQIDAVRRRTRQVVRSLITMLRMAFTAQMLMLIGRDKTACAANPSRLCYNSQPLIDAFSAPTLERLQTTLYNPCGRCWTNSQDVPKTPPRNHFCAPLRAKMQIATPERNRAAYAVMTGVVIVCGLASRRYALYLPAFLRKDAGDALYTVLVFVLLGLLRPRTPTLHNASMALLFSVLIEFSQLVHAPWIDAVRRAPLGHLVLGSGFAWHDMGCYVVGALLSAGAERLFCPISTRTKPTPL